VTFRSVRVGRRRPGTVASVPGAFLHPFARPTRDSFITLTRGDGALVWDADGNEYVDGMASLWYCQIGHGRREMADAIAAQASTLAAYSCFDPFTNAPADELAEQLAGLTTVPDARVFFCQSGSESVDTAMKLARLAHVLAGNPQRTLIISRMRGYHGTNFGGTTAQGLPPNKEGWGPLVPDVVQVPSDDVEALAQLMAERSDEVAAVITEPVQGAGGVWPPTDGYLESLRRMCDQHGALLIFDEVITGYGRLGTWFGAEYFGVVPDMVTLPTWRSWSARACSPRPSGSASGSAVGCARSPRTGSSTTSVATRACGRSGCTTARTL
jgi:adenosylmethionine-8-amino-7-oxononanoate aminotransferase